MGAIVNLVKVFANTAVRLLWKYKWTLLVEAIKAYKHIEKRSRGHKKVFKKKMPTEKKIEIFDRMMASMYSFTKGKKPSMDEIDELRDHVHEMMTAIDKVKGNRRKS